MSDRPIRDAVKSQYAATFQMLREAIGRVTDAEWLVGGPTWTDVPANSACHAMICARSYVDPNSGGLDWKKTNWDDLRYPPQNMPGRTEALAYLDQVEKATWAFLENTSEAGFLKSSGPNTQYTVLEHVIYAIRHMQHHTAQISHESKRRGLKAAAWRKGCSRERITPPPSPPPAG